MILVLRSILRFRRFQEFWLLQAGIPKLYFSNPIFVLKTVQLLSEFFIVFEYLYFLSYLILGNLPLSSLNRFWNTLYSTITNLRCLIRLFSFLLDIYDSSRNKSYDRIEIIWPFSSVRMTTTTKRFMTTSTVSTFDLVVWRRGKNLKKSGPIGSRLSETWNMLAHPGSYSIV